jgi:2'-hydroxyisoflavone reductase
VRVLVLGGTVFVGRHVVEAALARGDEVTLFNRGRTAAELFPGVERLRGDRDGGLDALRGGEWDVVVDTSGFVPRVVRQSAELLADRVALYVFVSSISVYADLSRPGVTENAPVLTVEDETTEDIDEHYGALKASCEEVVEQALPGRALIVRPGLIAGPDDPTGRFTYWPMRLARGGEVLAPAPPERFTQFIDVRDLVEWMRNIAGEGATGTFSATGMPVSFGELLRTCAAVTGTDSDVEWVDEDVLVEAGIHPWSELPLWLPGEEDAGHAELDVTKALDSGLSLRPLEETVRDTLLWAQGLAGPAPRQADGRYRVATLTPEREAELLAAWHAR